MSVFENIDHAKISTILLSLWAVMIPGIVAYIIGNPGLILAMLTATIGIKYATVLAPIMLSIILVWYNAHYPGITSSVGA
jgi:hypothetical protein